MTPSTKLRILVLLLGFLSAPFIGQAQEAPNSKLYKAIMAQDSLLFNVGFNTCNIAQFESVVSNNFEFYHDKGGITPSKEAFISGFKNGLCKSPSTYQSRRELIPGSTEVFPLYKDNHVLYGAIQTGRHRFYEKEAGKEETFASTARFTHVWQLENGAWKLIRSLSYDHVNATGVTFGAAAFANDAEIETWLKDNKFPAMAIGVINDGKLQQIKVFGELKQGTPAPYNTIFNVASLAKPITAMVTMKLVNAGKWKLDEPLATYWTDPDIAHDPRSKKLTTRHVLTHQTGFPNWRWMNESKKLAFQFDPGTKYQYSGEGMEYLRRALEKKFHKTLDQLADSLIFKPLNMKDTKYVWDKGVDESRFALWHNTKGGLYDTYKNTSANAADDLLTTVEDYSKFLISVMNGGGLSKETFNEMVSHQVKTKDNIFFGLGMEVYDLGNGEYALSHSGSDHGTAALFFILPKSKKGMIIMTNVDDGYRSYEKMVKTFLGDNGQKIIDIAMKE
ncbi:serine hydrolase [Rufibacter aurantiacus]|uniref:serine hydrolase n=1 Tax=Rufibacter aurantiacus TaxID=2817374 RepID=UPI001B308C3D|nr:serine hydrolase [Rufibacter aurantiacus]